MKKCPNCEVVMNEVLKIGVAIDVCPKCMGVWLDKGELDKIIEMSNSYETQSGNIYRKDDHEFYDDDDHHNHGKYDKHHDDHNEHNGKIQYDRNGRPMRRKGGFSDILGNLFD